MSYKGKSWESGETSSSKITWLLVFEMASIWFIRFLRGLQVLLRWNWVSLIQWDKLVCRTGIGYVTSGVVPAVIARGRLWGQAVPALWGWPPWGGGAPVVKVGGGGPETPIVWGPDTPIVCWAMVTTGGCIVTGAIDTVAMETGVPATAAIETGTVATLAATVRRVPAATIICWGVGVWAEVIWAGRGCPALVIVTAGTVKAAKLVVVRLEPSRNCAFWSRRNSLVTVKSETCVKKKQWKA